MTEPVASLASTQRRWDLHDPATQRTAFRALQVIFGIVWVFNVGYQLHPAYIDGLFLKSLAAHPGQAAWYGAYTQWVSAWVVWIGARWVALFTAFVGAVLALSLLTGRGVRCCAWMGAVFTFIMWTLNGHLGGPYGQGATDPGTLIVYSLVFVTILLIEPIRAGKMQDAGSRASRYRTVRLLFGALWAFDAAWKWTPYFIHHSLSYLTQSEAGQPAWIVAYIQFFVHAIRAIGQDVFGVGAALVETLLAVSLLTNRGMRYFLPIGFLYSLGVWTVAEGWGGPYGAVTGVGGDVLGTTIIYALLYLYLMVMYPPVPAHAKHA